MLKLNGIGGRQASSCTSTYSTAALLQPLLQLQIIFFSWRMNGMGGSGKHSYMEGTWTSPKIYLTITQKLSIVSPAVSINRILLFASLLILLLPFWFERIRYQPTIYWRMELYSDMSIWKQNIVILCWFGIWYVIYLSSTLGALKYATRQAFKDRLLGDHCVLARWFTFGVDWDFFFHHSTILYRDECTRW